MRERGKEGSRGQGTAFETEWEQNGVSGEERAGAERER